MPTPARARSRPDPSTARCSPVTNSASFVGSFGPARVSVDHLAGDLCADRRQLARHVLVTAIDMPRVAKHALALGAECGDHQGRAGTDVRDCELGTAQPAWAMHHRVNT